MVPYGAVWYNAVWLAAPPTVEDLVPTKKTFSFLIFFKKQLIKFETNNGVCGMSQKVGGVALSCVDLLA